MNGDTRRFATKVVRGLLVERARERAKGYRTYWGQRELARRIRKLSKKLPADARDRLILDGRIDVESSDWRLIADGLLLEAATHPERLIALGELLCKPTGKPTPRSAMEKLVDAYERCTAVNPTISEVRLQFTGQRWPGDVYARRTLRKLWLPVRCGNLGRPKKK